RKHQCRKLIAKRFPCSGGHDCKYISSRKDLSDDRLLFWSKCVITKVGFEGGIQLLVKFISKLYFIYGFILVHQQYLRSILSFHKLFYKKYIPNLYYSILKIK